MTGAPLLEVTDLQIEFRTADSCVHAVNGVSYSLDEGETLGIVGESGCGKSVSALALMRLLPRPAGQIVGGMIRFSGRNLLELSEAELRAIRGKEIAMVFQDPLTALNPVLPIGQQIAEAMTLHLGLSGRQARARVGELLDLVGIPDARRRIDDYPHQFSGGMRQRVMIAMALSCQPRLLIADEPTTALDVTIQAQIVELVRRLQREFGMAVIWITHDLGVVARLADRVMVMYAGRSVEEGPVDELFENPRHPYTLGLLGSVPRLDDARRESLQPIEGMPPDLTEIAPGCLFEPRCRYAIPRCLDAAPPLKAVVSVEESATGRVAHHSACWRADALAESAPVGPG
ncbi:MAG TPA: ABC transporter ATP-binding protein [Chloroflexota bacterium]|nr:ABC transporter ATP-binding protein [Chloroflexota bacterium]